MTDTHGTARATRSAKRRVPTDPDRRHAAFFDAVGPGLLGRYTDGGARSSTTGRTPKNAHRSNLERAWRKAFRGVQPLPAARTLRAVGQTQPAAGGVGGPKPKATEGALPRVPRTARRRHRSTSR